MASLLRKGKSIVAKSGRTQDAMEEVNRTEGPHRPRVERDR